jgi:ElaB/YqjD/DUF883 family membrane-anchored ribosome-binding protein
MTTKTKKIFIWSALLILLMSSCASVKKSVSSTKSTVDSSVIAEKDSIIRVEKSKRERIESELRELQVTGISFDTIFLPGDTILNTVTVRTDGTVDAMGRIKSVTVTNQKLQRTLKDLQEDYDSLAQVKQRVETKVIKETVTKTKNVKRTWPWWWFAICAAIGLIVGGIFRDKFLSLFKIKSMKLLNILAAIMICFSMQGCVKFAGTEQWVFAEGLWLILVIPVVGAFLLIRSAYIASKSGSEQQTKEGMKDTPGNVSMFSMGRFWIGVALVVATIVFYFYQNSQR